jgi:hypothetical protein
MVKMEQKSRQREQTETRRQFRFGLIRHILKLTVPKIVENTRGKDASMKDLAEVMRPIMDQYQDSDMTRKMLGIENYEDWDSFFDEVVNIVFRKVKDEKEKETADSSVSLKSQDLKQKNLFR